jgi:hypothetical protein
MAGPIPGIIVACLTTITISLSLAIKRSIK